MSSTGQLAVLLNTVETVIFYDEDFTVATHVGLNMKLGIFDRRGMHVPFDCTYMY